MHHISINPFKDERLTDAQVFRIIQRAEEKYRYRPDEHQRIVVEHIKDGRQHFHVMWNRVSLRTGKAVWPGLHWNKSKETAREMERELGLRTPMPRRGRGGGIWAARRRSFGMNGAFAPMRTSRAFNAFSIKSALCPSGRGVAHRDAETQNGWKDFAVAVLETFSLATGTRNGGNKSTAGNFGLADRCVYADETTLSSCVDLAYWEEYRKWIPRILAAAKDQSLSRDQRRACVVALRERQRAAAKAARNLACDESFAILKAKKRKEKQVSEGTANLV